MPRPKLYKNGRRKTTLEASLSDRVARVARHAGLTVTVLLDEAVADWLSRRATSYLRLPPSR